MRILHVDDHRMFREALGEYLKRRRDDWIIESCATFDDAFSLIDKNTYDLFIFDIHVPGTSFYEFSDDLSARGYWTPVLVLTMETGCSSILDCLKRNVLAYVTKESGSEQVLEAAEKAAAGNYCFDQIVLKEMVRALRVDPASAHSGYSDILSDLTTREREVFYQLAGEKSLDRIAEDLFISRKTVENHRSSIYSKLNIRDRHDLCRLAEKQLLA